MQREVVIFANPIAGAGRARQVALQLTEALDEAGLKPTLIFDRVDGLDVRQLPTEMGAAIAIGGDGTLRAVARKLTEAKLPELPPLLVVPMGTANLMGKHLGIAGNAGDLVERIVAAVLRREVMYIDAATANGIPFLLVAGAGIDGEIIHELEKRRQGPIALLSYAVPSALTLLNYKYPEMTVSVDGMTIMRETPGVCLVGNIPEYGTGFPMLPFAQPDDGLLDIVTIPVASRADVIMMFIRTMVGEHLQSEGVSYVRGKHIEVTTAEPVAVQADGEAAGFTPLVIDMLPVRVPFILP